MAMFSNILSCWESAELNQEEAAELLEVSERTFRRWTRRYEEEGRGHRTLLSHQTTFSVLASRTMTLSVGLRPVRAPVSATSGKWAAICASCRCSASS
jgi:hypothetical protein